MTFRTRFLTVTNALFVVFLLIQLLPDSTPKDPQTLYIVAVASAIEVVYLAICATTKNISTRNSATDVVAVIFIVFIAWVLLSVKTELLPPKLFPAPGIVFAQMATDYEKIAIGIGSSLGIIGEGFIIGGLCALVLGLALGWNARVSSSTHKIVAFLSAIPPIVYIPYAIALLPTFHAASVLVIFLATFWPVLTGTLAGVSGVDQRAIDSAKVLNVRMHTMLLRVVLPGALPLIFNGFNIGLTLSFILLTSAEMIGGSSGMGYYVKYYSDFGDYTRILVGIIVIGVVITAISLVFGKLQKYFLRWR